MGLRPGKIRQLFGIAQLQAYRNIKEYCHLYFLPFEGKKSNFIRLLLMWKEGKGQDFNFFLLVCAID